MSLIDRSFDRFIFEDSIDYKGLGLYLHEKAEENGLTYKYFINFLLKDQEYSTYILYSLIYEYDLNNMPKLKIWRKLMSEGFYEIDNILDRDAFTPTKNDWYLSMLKAEYEGDDDLAALMLEEWKKH